MKIYIVRFEGGIDYEDSWQEDFYYSTLEDAIRALKRIYVTQFKETDDWHSWEIRQSIFNIDEESTLICYGNMTKIDSSISLDIAINKLSEDIINAFNIEDKGYITVCKKEVIPIKK